VSRAADQDVVLAHALSRRAAAWQAAAVRARALMKGKAEVATASRLLEDYRLLARDLASARRLLPRSRTREYLEAAYAAAHAALHKSAPHPLYELQSICRERLPRAVRALAPYITWVALLFVCAVFSGYQLIRTYPELIALFASPSLIAAVERGELWTRDLLNIVPSSILSVQILTNNIVVSVFAFCAGFLFGLGTFYIVVLNGVMLGAIFAFTGQHGLDAELFSFVVAHGCVEISCLVLSGAAGAAVGNALIRPGSLRRGAAFREAAARGGLVMLACIVLLMGAGLIEGYVSPRPAVPLAARAALGVGYWLIMLALLRGWFFGRRTQAAP
jgi:uncharacterized membrane protein SpoIIM required for sporulation